MSKGTYQLIMPKYRCDYTVVKKGYSLINIDHVDDILNHTNCAYRLIGITFTSCVVDVGVIAFE